MIRFMMYLWQLDRNNVSLTNKYGIRPLKFLEDSLKHNSLLNQTS